MRQQRENIPTYIRQREKDLKILKKGRTLEEGQPFATEETLAQQISGAKILQSVVANSRKAFISVGGIQNAYSASGLYDQQSHETDFAENIFLQGEQYVKTVAAHECLHDKVCRCKGLAITDEVAREHEALTQMAVIQNHGGLDVAYASEIAQVRNQLIPVIQAIFGQRQNSETNLINEYERNPKKVDKKIRRAKAEISKPQSRIANLTAQRLQKQAADIEQELPEAA